MSSNESKPTRSQRVNLFFKDAKDLYDASLYDSFIKENPGGSVLLDSYRVENVGDSRNDRFHGRYFRSDTHEDVTDEAVKYLDQYKAYRTEKLEQGRKRKEFYEEYVKEKKDRPGRDATMLVAPSGPYKQVTLGEGKQGVLG